MSTHNTDPHDNGRHHRVGLKERWQHSHEPVVTSADTTPGTMPAATAGQPAGAYPGYDTGAYDTPSHAPHPVAEYRVVLDVIQRWLALLGVVLCALQVAFAAVGFWGSQANPGDQATGMAAFLEHAVNGQVLTYLAAVLLVLGVIAWANWRAWVIPLVVLLLLYFVQGALVGLAFNASGTGFDVTKWFGGLHAFSGMVITAGFVWLFIDRSLHPLTRSGERGRSHHHRSREYGHREF